MFVFMKIIIFIFMSICQQCTGYHTTLCLNDTYRLHCPRSTIQIDQVIFPFIDQPCNPRVPNYCWNQREEIRTRCNGKESCSITTDEFVNSSNCPVLPRRISTEYLCQGFTRASRTICGSLDNISCNVGKIGNIKFGVLFEEDNICEIPIYYIKMCLKRRFQDTCLNKPKCDVTEIQDWCFFKPFSLGIDYSCVQRYRVEGDDSKENIGDSSEKSYGAATNDDDDDSSQMTTKQYNTTNVLTDNTTLKDKTEMVDGSNPNLSQNIGVVIIATIATLLVLWIAVAVCIIWRQKRKEKENAFRQSDLPNGRRLYHTLVPREISDSGVFTSDVSDSNDQQSHDYFVLDQEVNGPDRSNDNVRDYFILDPVETGYLRTNDHYSKIKDSYFEIRTTAERDNYSSMKDGDYDVTNNRRHISQNPGHIYNHTVENVYDHAVNDRQNEKNDNPNYDKVAGHVTK